MKKEEGASTRLWLEKYTHQADVKAGVTSYASEKFTLDSELIALIKKYLKKNHFTWDVFLHAIIGVLLCRLSSTSKITYGSAGAYAAKAGTPLPLLVDFNEKTTIRHYILSVEKQLGKNHAKLPENVDIHYLLLMASKTRTTPKKEKISPNKYPLVFHAIKNNIKWIDIFYHQENFNKQDIEFIFTHLTVLLTEISRSALNKKITQVNILTDDEKNKILNEWISPADLAAYPLQKQCIQDLFIQQARDNPHNVAVFHNEFTCSYRELYNASSLIVATLMKHGVKHGDRVCVLMDRSASLLAAMLAVFRCGAIFVPINPKYPHERIAYVLEDSSPVITLVHDIAKLPIGMRDNAHVLSKALDTCPAPTDITTSIVSPEAIAYLVYTSGTTGKPKGVMIQHQSLTNIAEWYRLNFNINGQDRSSQFASQGFDSFFCETLPFLAVGASIGIIDDNIKLTPNLFIEWLKENKITVCDLTTAYAQILFCMPWPDSMALRLMKIGGEAVAHYPNQPFKFDIWNTYGPTEATIEATYAKIYSANSPSPFLTHKEAPPIGKPIINSKMYIVDQYFQPVPPGIAGELLIGGIIISPGYLNRQDLTNERFITMTANSNSDRVYCTGDLVKWQPDGNIEYVGRIDHQVKIRGYRIEPAEIEQAISLHPDVKEVVVVAKDAINNQKQLIAYIVPNLNKERFLYQQRCLIEINKDNFFEAISDDISKEGICISGTPENIRVGTLVNLHVKLPGLNESRAFKARIIWSSNSRCGLTFELNDADKKIVSKSIDHYLSNHNIMDMILSNAAKRSLKKALQSKMPEYMIPSTFVKLLEFPLNYSGKVDVKSLPPPQSIDHLLRTKFIPASTPTEKKLAEIWRELLGKQDISMSDNFFDLGGSSISAAALSIRVLKEFNITIPVKLLFDLSFIPILSEFIDTKGEKFTEKSAIQDEIIRDSELSDQIQPSTNLTPHLHEPQHILLTGAAGFLGVYLLRELLATTNAKIHCLVRQGEFESAAKRLNSAIANFNLQNDVSLTNRRIIVIPSDISHDKFGLPLDHYNSMLDKIDLIYHCGAQVNIMASYNKLRGSNVQGTIEIIKFATQRKDKPIHYISTLSSAYRKDENGLLSEEFPTETYDHLFGGYAISKWVSERLLTQAHDRGLPVCIYRSGYIFGQSDTGITSLNDALLMLIKGCIQLGYAPIMEEKITILPVDYVSKTIVAISLALGEKSSVFHIDHPIGIMWSDLISWLNEYGYKIKKIPMQEWQHLLEKIEPENALFPFLPYYLSLKETHQSPDVNTEKAIQILNELKLPFPEISDNQLNIYMDYLCKIGFLPQPEPEHPRHPEKQRDGLVDL